MMADKELLEIFESEMARIEFSHRAESLYLPIIYTLEPGGKRLRPLLCMKACGALECDPLKAINQAMAVEMFHNFTLIHDDVMDKSDTRRGRPTVFAKWGSSQAILSGDALLTAATQKAIEGVSDRNAFAILSLFNRTALEVYEGQQLDIDFEERDDVTTDEYIEMIRLKTSVLLGCACAMGALAAECSDKATVDALYRYGEKLGMAFQLRDDWLDTFGSPEEFGKPIGGDIRNRKKTWLFITASSERPFEMAEALKATDAEIVRKVTEVYRSLQLSERCDSLIKKYCEEAIDELSKAKISESSKGWFASLAEKLCKRNK